MTNRRKLLVALVGLAALSACGSARRQGNGSAGTPNRYGGAAARTFSLPYYDVRSGVISTFHYMAIRLDALQPIPDGESVGGTRQDLHVQVSVVRRQARITDVRVDAWRSAPFGDTAAAEAVLAMIERRLALTGRQ